MSRQPKLSNRFISFVKVWPSWRPAGHLSSGADVATSKPLVEEINDTHSYMAFYTCRTHVGAAEEDGTLRDMDRVDPSEEVSVRREGKYTYITGEDSQAVPQLGLTIAEYSI